ANPLTLAYWLLVGIGLEALRRCYPGMWCSNNSRKSCGVFFIGRKMLGRLQLAVLQVLTALLDALLREAKSGDRSGRLTPFWPNREHDHASLFRICSP
ncbi:MAG: hypothetical protein ACUVQR_13920, partial [Thermogutta sp.]